MRGTSLATTKGYIQALLPHCTKIIARPNMRKIAKLTVAGVKKRFPPDIKDPLEAQTCGLMDGRPCLWGCKGRLQNAILKEETACRSTACYIPATEIHVRLKVEETANG